MQPGNQAEAYISYIHIYNVFLIYTHLQITYYALILYVYNCIYILDILCYFKSVCFKRLLNPIVVSNLRPCAGSEDKDVLPFFR